MENKNIIIFDNLIKRKKSDIIGEKDTFITVKAVMPEFKNANAKGDIREVASLEEVGAMAASSAQRFNKLRA